MRIHELVRQAQQNMMEKFLGKNYIWKGSVENMEKKLCSLLSFVD